MRIAIPTLVLSLAMVSSVYAAPTPATDHLEKQNVIIDKIKSLFEDILHSMNPSQRCSACVAALVGVKGFAHLNKNWALDAINGICPSVSNRTADVCSGLVYSQGPVILDSLLSADITGGDGKFICFQVLGICSPPAIGSGTLTFPKPRPANLVVHAPSGILIDVVHLSDWHVDTQYAQGSEADCKKPLCCRKYADSPAVANRSASSWGDYNCDPPPKLGKDMLNYIPKVAKPSFAIFTGDVPPHDVWLESESSVVPMEAVAYNVMAGLDAKIKIYPTVGNHEAGPVNLFPTTTSGGDISWLYSSLADDWTHWLPKDAVKSVKRYGAYTVSPQPGFRIISLNTNFCYTMNFYLYGHTKDYDPNGEIKWLIDQLQAAEDTGERVWIIGHVGPSQTDCIRNWSALYYQVVQRYSPHVIAEQFFGHTHYDEFALYYGPGAKSAQNAIATAWIGPSVTPYTNLNPGFRVYKVDTKSWNVFDSLTYIADLNQAASWDASGSSPNWHLEYSARAAYGAYVPLSATAPLSASWWHSVTMAFETTPAAFQEYWSYRGKSAGLTAACTPDSPCAAEMICDLRAGKSSDACSSISSLMKKGEDGEEWKEAAGEIETRAPYKRANDTYWNKKLCGIY